MKILQKCQGIDKRLCLIFPNSFPDSAVDMLCFSSPTCEISDFFFLSGFSSTNETLLSSKRWNLKRSLVCIFTKLLSRWSALLVTHFPVRVCLRFGSTLKLVISTVGGWWGAITGTTELSKHCGRVLIKETGFSLSLFVSNAVTRLLLINVGTALSPWKYLTTPTSLSSAILQILSLLL